MKKIEKRQHVNYYCINGAYHTDSCNEHCWNNHPEAVKDTDNLKLVSKYEYNDSEKIQELIDWQHEMVNWVKMVDIPIKVHEVRITDLGKKFWQRIMF